VFVWPEHQFDGPGGDIAYAGVIALAIAALASPYCFAPRPFARAVTRPVPVVIAMSLAAIGVSGLLTERVTVFALALGTFGVTRALCRWLGISAAFVVSALALGVLIAPVFVESYSNQCGGVAPGVRTAVLALNPLLAGSSGRLDLLHLPMVYEILPIAVREFRPIPWYCTVLGWAVTGGLCWLGSEAGSAQGELP